MDLCRAFRLDRRARVALVGAGGKTTALFQLARAFDPPVVVTTSTHLGDWQCGLADHHAIITNPARLGPVFEYIEGVTLLTAGPSGDGRFAGLDSESLDSLDRLAREWKIPVLIEADGSRQKPLKAPAPYEPVIPRWVSHVVVVAGLAGVNQPLTEHLVHRAALYSEISGVGVGEPVDADSLVKYLIDPRGGLKNIPAGAKRILLLNQADDEKLYSHGMRIANNTKQTYHQTIISTLIKKQVQRVIEPTAGLILPREDLGNSRHVAETVLKAGLDPVLVVVGGPGKHVKPELSNLPLKVIEIRDWEIGQGISIRKGVEVLPQNIGAVVVLTAQRDDHTEELIKELVRQHEETLAAIITFREGWGAAPILFDRDVFSDFKRITVDAHLQAVLKNRQATYLNHKDTGVN